MWVWGNGGHAKVVRQLVSWKPISIIDDADPLYPWKPEYAKDDGLIAIGDNATRKNVAEKAEQLGVTFRIIAYWQPSPGTVVMAGGIIQADATVGKHSIINTGATVDHDCNIGDFVHIAPGCHLCGNVTVGEGAFLGAGTIVTPGSVIEPWAFIKAGSLVTPKKILARL